MSRKYKFHNPDGVYFVSFAVINWVNVFIAVLLIMQGKKDCWMLLWLNSCGSDFKSAPACD